MNKFQIGVFWLNDFKSKFLQIVNGNQRIEAQINMMSFGVLQAGY